MVVMSRSSTDRSEASAKEEQCLTVASKSSVNGGTEKIMRKTSLTVSCIKEDEVEVRDDSEFSPLESSKSADTTAAGNLHSREEEKDEEAEYEKGGTDLFLAIESCEWERALDVCRVKPKEACIWITSEGSGEETVFNWSVWRRLPIHEACRRQPPPILITTLLSLYPESANLMTHFGELPIHLAAGCGACPEVVNCILAANPTGVNVSDNGGRTPLEIMKETGAMREDSHLVIESIERCTAAYDQRLSFWDDKVSKLVKNHKAELEAAKRQQEQVLSEKDLKISDLLKEVKRGESKALDLSTQIDEREKKIDSKRSIEKNLWEMVSKLEDEISDLRSQNRGLHARISEMDDKCMEHEATIGRLKSRIGDLEGDLVEISKNQDSVVEKELRQAEIDLRRMVEGQRFLMTRIRREREAARTIIVERSISLPTTPKPRRDKLISKEGSKSPAKKAPVNSINASSGVSPTQNTPAPKASQKGLDKISESAKSSVKSYFR